MTDTCDCSEEYGPCELHGETVTRREGASTRTADDLQSVFVADAVALGATLSPYGKSAIAEIDAALESERSMGVAWLPNDETGAGLADELGSLVSQMETELHTLGYSVYWEDGYRIVRVTGGPLSSDAE